MSDGHRLPKAINPDAVQAQRHLRAWRKSRNLSQGALAEHLGNTTSTISGWETGYRAMDLADLVKLANFYGVHPAALLIAPATGEAKVRKMQAACDLAERLSDQAVTVWLEVGNQMTERSID